MPFYLFSIFFLPLLAHKTMTMFFLKADENHAGDLCRFHTKKDKLITVQKRQASI